MISNMFNYFFNNNESDLSQTELLRQRSPPRLSPQLSVSDDESISPFDKMVELVVEYYNNLSRYMVGEPLSESNKYKLITGPPQCGKTFEVIGLIHLNLLLTVSKFVSVVVVDNNQKTQFYHRYINDTIDLVNYLKHNGIEETLISHYFPIYPTRFGGRLRNSESNENIQKVKNTVSKQVVLFINNYNFLGRFMNEIPDEMLNVPLFIDEAHSIGGYKKTGFGPSGTDLHDENCKFDGLITRFKDLSSSVYLITATPDNIITTEPKLYSSQIFKLKPSESYRGISNVVFHQISNSRDTKQVPKEELKNLVTILSSRDLYSRNLNGRVDYHPINLLAKIEYTNLKQSQTQDYFNPTINPDLEEVIRNGSWTTLTYNQKGITLYSPNLPQKIKINKKKYVKNEKNYFVMRGVEICDVYHYLARNGGVSKFPRIMNIVYNNASEGITFSSTYDVNENYNWHLTDAMYMVSKTICSANLEQTFGRCFGNHSDDLKFNIWCVSNDKEITIKGFNFHTGLVDEMVKSEESVSVRDCILNKEYYKNRVPKRIFKIKGVGNLITQVNNPNKRREDRILKDKYASNILKDTNPLFSHLERIVEPIMMNDEYIQHPTEEEIEEYGREEYDCIVNRKFELWSKSKTKISNLIRDIDINRIYTHEEFTDFIKSYGNHFNKFQLTHSYTENRHYIGKIFKVDDNNNTYFNPILKYEYIRKLS